MALTSLIFPQLAILLVIWFVLYFFSNQQHVCYGMTYSKIAFTYNCSGCGSFGQFAYYGSQYYIYTTASGSTNNLLRIDLTGMPPQPITTLSVGIQPKFASTDSNSIFFENAGTIYQYDIYGNSTSMYATSIGGTIYALGFEYSTNDH